MSLISGVVFTNFDLNICSTMTIANLVGVYTGMGLKPSQNGFSTDQNSKPSVENPEVSNGTVSEKLPVSEVSNATMFACFINMLVA